MQKLDNLWGRLNHLVPEPKCSTKDNDYDSIIWNDERTQPTFAECEAVGEEIQLEAKKDIKVVEINAEKIRILLEGVSIDGVEVFDNDTETYILQDGVVFDSDYGARTAYTELKDEIEDDPLYEEENWKSSNGYFVKMNSGTYNKVKTAGKAQIKDVFKWLKTKYKEIYKADTEAEVEAIDTTYAPIP